MHTCGVEVGILRIEMIQSPVDRLKMDNKRVEVNINDQRVRIGNYGCLCLYLLSDIDIIHGV